MLTNAEDRKSPLEYFLGIFTDVKGGEGISALLLALNVFMLLTAYYIIKPVREALILVMPNGVQYKSYMAGAIAIALLFAVPAYSRAAQRFARNRLVVGVTLFFISHLFLFYVGSRIPAVESNLGLIFFLWVGIFNMMVVAQFWAFANDVYSEEQGKRLFPLIGVGASVGAFIGSKIAEWLIKPVGVYQMLLVAGGLLFICAVLTQVVHVRESKAAKTKADTKDAGPEDSKPQAAKASADRQEGAFQMVFKHRYLTLLALFSLTFTLVNTNGEYILGKLITEDSFKTATAEISEADVTAFMAREGADARIEEVYARAPEDYGSRPLAEVKADVARTLAIKERAGPLIGATFGNFFSYVNLLSLLMQTFLVSRLVKYLGLGRAFFILPFIALFDAAAVAIIPAFYVLRVGKTFENATDYSLNNTLRNMLWLPTTREMKYRAKQAVDSFFVRMGDATHGGLIYVAVALLGLGVQAIALTNVVLCLIWLALAWAIVAENRRLSAATAEASGETDADG